MLQSIRDRASGWIAYIIVILISIPFALWGIHEYFGGDDPLVAAEVNGIEIPVRAFTTTYQQQRRYLQSVMGGNLPPQFDEENLKKNVVRGMVRSELLRQKIDSSGYRVSDQVLFNTIRSMPVFQENGQFSKQRYEQILRSQGRPKPVFEGELRQDIRKAQFESGIRGSAFLPQRSLEDFLRLKNQSRDIAYFIVPADAEKASEAFGEGQIEKFYTENLTRFQTPERVKLAFIELDEVGLSETLDADETALLQFYDEQADRFVSPEQRRARHILIKLPDSAQQPLDTRKTDEVKRRAEDLVSRARNGEDFSSLATEYSDDQLSISSGGDLGFIVRGDMDPLFEEVLFGLELQQISDPVKTERGYQIIQLVDVKPAEQQPFEKVRDRVALEYKQRAAETRFIELTEQLLTLSYEQPDSLDPAADALNVPVQTTQWMTRQAGQGIGANVKIREVAFSNEVLGEKRNSELVELSDGKIVVLRVDEHEPAKPRSLEEVRGEIKQILTQRSAREVALKAGKESVVQLRQGTSLQAVADKIGAELIAPGYIKRDDTELDPSLVRKVFTLTKPTSGSSTIGGVQLANGGYAVIALQSVRAGVTDNDARTTVESQQFDDYGFREFEAIYQALESRAEVQVFYDNL